MSSKTGPPPNPSTPKPERSFTLNKFRGALRRNSKSSFGSPEPSEVQPGRKSTDSNVSATSQQPAPLPNSPKKSSSLRRFSIDQVKPSRHGRSGSVPQDTTTPPSTPPAATTTTPATAGDFDPFSEAHDTSNDKVKKGWSVRKTVKGALKRTTSRLSTSSVASLGKGTTGNGSPDPQAVSESRDTFPTPPPVYTPAMEPSIVIVQEPAELVEEPAPAPSTTSPEPVETVSVIHEITATKAENESKPATSVDGATPSLAVPDAEEGSSAPVAPAIDSTAEEQKLEEPAAPSQAPALKLEASTTSLDWEHVDHEAAKDADAAPFESVPPVSINKKAVPIAADTQEEDEEEKEDVAAAAAASAAVPSIVEPTQSTDSVEEKEEKADKLPPLDVSTSYLRAMHLRSVELSPIIESPLSATRDDNNNNEQQEPSRFSIQISPVDARLAAGAAAIPEVVRLPSPMTPHDHDQITDREREDLRAPTPPVDILNEVQAEYEIITPIDTKHLEASVNGNGSSSAYGTGKEFEGTSPALNAIELGVPLPPSSSSLDAHHQASSRSTPAADSSTNLLGSSSASTKLKGEEEDTSLTATPASASPYPAGGGAASGALAFIANTAWFVGACVVVGIGMVVGQVRSYRQMLEGLLMRR